MHTVFLLAATLFALLLVPSSFALEAAPANDHFADAVVLGTTGDIEGTNIAATKETGEPNHAENPGGHSVWYTWTAPADGSVPHLSIRLFGDFDTLLGVYTGSAVDALAEVAANDDSGFGASSVSFATTPGTTYHIAADGFAGKIGRFTMRWGESPPNDNFAEAISLAGTSGRRTADSIAGATVELGEPDPFEVDASVWYTWTPPVNGTYKLTTIGSSFDTVLAVYEGSSLETLELLRLNDDDPDRGCCSSWIALVDAEASTSYRIQVSDLNGEGGRLPGRLALEWGPLILGTNGPDNLVGSPDPDEIRSRGGTDVISAGGGNDVVFSGPGNDVVRGGAGADFLLDRFGGDDLLAVGTGNDTLNTRDFRGGDRLRGGRGDDRCRGDRGDSRRSC